MAKLQAVAPQMNFKYCTLSEYFRAVESNLSRDQLVFFLFPWPKCLVQVQRRFPTLYLRDLRFLDRILLFAPEVEGGWLSRFLLFTLKIARDMESLIYLTEISHSTFVLSLLNSNKEINSHLQDAIQVLSSIHVSKLFPSRSYVMSGTTCLS
jgi:hypothetical protein